jgi:Leucine Rich repeat
LFVLFLAWGPVAYVVFDVWVNLRYFVHEPRSKRILGFERLRNLLELFFESLPMLLMQTVVYVRSAPASGAAAIVVSWVGSLAASLVIAFKIYRGAKANAMRPWTYLWTILSDGGTYESEFMPIAESTTTESSFRNMVLGTEGLTVLAALLETNTSLQFLDIARTGAGPPSVRAIAEHCRRAALTSALRSVSLSGNPSIGDSGAAWLAWALCDGPLLHAAARRAAADPAALVPRPVAPSQLAVRWQTLALRGCGLADDGCVALANALRYNAHLQSLDLRSNAITDAGAEALLHALFDLRTPTGRAHAEADAALPTNTTLTELLLDHNDIDSQDILDAIRGALLLNKRRSRLRAEA